MADILLDEQSTPVTPSAGQGVMYFDSSASAFLQKNDGGLVQGDITRAAVAAQGAGFASDTYVTNSGLIIPSVSMQAGMFWKWTIVASKTAAGVAAPVYQIRIGSAQTTADTSRLSMTGSAQTANADDAVIVVICTCRSVGVTGVIQGSVRLQHNLAATGFASTPAGFAIVNGTSAGFDNTALGGQYIGLSINGGASAAWTVTQVQGEMFYG